MQTSSRVNSWVQINLPYCFQMLSTNKTTNTAMNFYTRINWTHSHRLRTHTWYNRSHIKNTMWSKLVNRNLRVNETKTEKYEKKHHCTDNWKTLNRLTLREKCPYSEPFWSVFSRIRTEYGKIRSISPYSVQIRENMNQNNSKYGHFSPSVMDTKIISQHSGHR